MTARHTLAIYVGAAPEKLSEDHVILRRCDAEPSPGQIQAMMRETGAQEFVIRRIGRAAEPERHAWPVDAPRETPGAMLTPGRLMVVATEEVKADLGRLIPTVLAWHPGLEIHVVGDAAACRMAEGIGRFFGRERGITLHDWITPESLERAEVECRDVVRHSPYWKMGPIWWKLEGMRRLFEQGGAPVMLVDSDIVFCRPWRMGEMVFLGVDLVLSPFHWPGDVPVIPRGPGSVERWPVSAVHGWHNAGMLLAGRGEIPEEWMRLTRAGVGGFYEQGCLDHLAQRFRHDVLGTAHNWGIWRKHAPGPDVASVHRHAETPVRCAVSRAIEDKAMKSVVAAYEVLGKEGAAE